MANTYSNSSLFQKLSNIKCLYPQKNELIQIRTEGAVKETKECAKNVQICFYIWATHLMSSLF